MDVDIICLAAQELGYDSVTPEQCLVIERFVKGQGVRQSSNWVWKVVVLLAFASNF